MVQASSHNKSPPPPQQQINTKIVCGGRGAYPLLWKSPYRLWAKLLVLILRGYDYLTIWESRFRSGRNTNQLHFFLPGKVSYRIAFYISLLLLYLHIVFCYSSLLNGLYNKQKITNFILYTKYRTKKDILFIFSIHNYNMI